jgi:eukaryotic-like serine/threonine-protein kinase
MTPPAPPQQLVGNIVDGRYKLERMLGRGGMGCVYGAEHVGIGRPVAIKVLDPQLVSDANARKRFEREAQSTGKLRHANCVGVTDFGALPDGSPYLAMELVDGITLEHVLDTDTRVPVERAVHIMRHVLRGLAHAHAQGLVHRDLKPCNIMLVTEGADRDFAKILDFGLARLVGGAGGDRLTQVGVVCGTPRYMSPEQALDSVIGPHVDLYAASIILFEMITGRTPFDADEPMQILRMHLKDEVPRIAELAPGVDVPAKLEALIRRGLAKAPADRPQSADHYLAELDRAMPGGDATMIRPSKPKVARAATPKPVKPSRVKRLLTDAAARMPRGKKRYAIAAAAGIALGAIAVALIVGGKSSGSGAAAAAGGGDDGGEPELEMDPVDVSSPDPAIDDALQLARAGHGQDAARKLKQLQHDRPGDARVPYALGRVYDGLGWPRPEIDAYHDAIRLDPALKADPRIIHDLIDLLDSRSTGGAAYHMLEVEIGSPAVPALIDASLRHPSGTVRDRAEKLRAKLAPS